MTPHLVLISHVLCPYVQRAVIVLKEKGVPFERLDVDLAHKPEWLLASSPLGKTPVLLVDGVPIFESAVICEFLDETVKPRLHPACALDRARHRAWMEFGSSLLDTIGAFYNAKDSASLTLQIRQIRSRLEQLESALGEGPFFGGDHFGLVDAVFGPVFRYFDVFEGIGDFCWFDGLRRVVTWRAALASRPSVREAVDARYPELLRQFLRARGSELSRMMQRVDLQH
ncbi:glutathione S-transferase family protein [Acidovorax sacchari]|uniref:glutathione S-transferase family protein n=1 Tax=Acidovorax sacchari TaxID=3230736 RepID=UPI0039E47450